MNPGVYLVYLHIHTKNNIIRTYILAENMFLSSIVNIGCHRELDNKWVTQYSALMCILNVNGEILTWKLTKSVKFEAVQDIFISLKHRLETQERLPTAFSIDNCCSWRAKLQSIFGKEVKVTLDLFYAVQRVVRTISKRNKLSQMSCEHFRLIFRQEDDRGETRTLPTPNPGMQQCVHT